MNTIKPVPTTGMDNMTCRELGEYLLERGRLACPYGTTFIDAIPHQHKDAAEAQLKAEFELWFNSWIAPVAQELINRGHR